MEKQLIIDTFNTKRELFINHIMASFKPEANVTITEKQWVSGVMKELVSENGLETFNYECRLKDEEEALIDTLNTVIGELLPQIMPSFCKKWDRIDAKIQKHEDDTIARKDVFHKKFIKQ